MRYLKTYKLFESQNLDSLTNQFIDEYSHQYEVLDEFPDWATVRVADKRDFKK